MQETMEKIRLGSEAPNFTATTTEGSIEFHSWLGNSWGVLFSHPKDFTPVCTTELGRVAQLKGEFEKRDVKVIGLSVDSLSSHEGWIPDINETQNVTLNYPLIADENRTISQLYGMLDANSQNTLTARSVFIIGSDKKIKLTLTYPASTGRNFDEILRVIDSLQLTATQSLATPVDWKQGDDCIVVPSLSDEEAEKKFPKGINKVRPYLRYTPQP